ncbi:hypothetical protein MRB53_036613 [Persea americana]|nr:hypothetical protein MRB53_037993 [Persea americana]KAJ8613933.1 hypothetical protein MRB53_036787 [Persea americana]KAJ8614373.1 hypothetical protein MRB53_036571 [Persea americana]KAJ8614415.1 hypothetical protein MRB53_036613 [Persea americana]
MDNMGWVEAAEWNSPAASSMKRFPYIDGRKNLCTELSFMPRCILKMSQAGLGFEIHFGLERYSPFLAFGRGSFEAEEAAAPPTRGSSPVLGFRGQLSSMAKQGIAASRTLSQPSPAFERIRGRGLNRRAKQQEQSFISLAGRMGKKRSHLRQKHPGEQWLSTGEAFSETETTLFILPFRSKNPPKTSPPSNSPRKAGRLNTESSFPHYSNFRRDAPASKPPRAASACPANAEFTCLVDSLAGSPYPCCCAALQSDSFIGSKYSPSYIRNTEIGTACSYVCPGRRPMKDPPLAPHSVDFPNL